MEREEAAEPAYRRAVEAHHRALDLHERAAELHKQAADFHERHAAGEHALGHDDRAQVMERRADQERESEQLERTRADAALRVLQARVAEIRAGSTTP